MHPDNEHQGDPIARRLAHWVTNLTFQDLSPDVVRHAKRCMLDSL